jgi:putative iron-dependent peroxidase
MLDNMFIGDPPGNYDRLLDVSRAVTGSLFFVPSAAWLEAAAASADTAPLAPDSTPAPVPDTPDSSPQPSARDGSLGIGSLKTRDPS